MKSIVACWKSYVAPWWMKLLAVAFVVAAVSALISVDERRSWVPGWPRPTLVRYWDIDELRSKDSDRLPTGISISEIEGLDVQSRFTIEVPDADASRLSYVRLGSSYYSQAPASPGEERYATNQALRNSENAAKLLAQILNAPRLDTIEISGAHQVETLEPLRGSTRITRLITSDLMLVSSETSGTQEEQMTLLVDIVRSMPNLRTWGPPKTAWYLIDESLAQTLQSHPSLQELLAPNDTFARPETSMYLNLRQRLPDLEINASFVNELRFYMAWGVFTVAVIASNLVIAMLAEMLVTSSASMLPRHAPTHRLAALILLLLIASAGALVLIKVGTAVVPAVLLSLLGVLMPAAMMAYDGRRQTPGTLLLPMCLTPCVPILVIQSVRDRGQYWMWLERLLAGDDVLIGLMLLAALVGAAAVIGWRVVPRYASALAGVGRASAMVASRREMLRTLGRQGDRGDSKVVSARGAIAASKALSTGRLASPATPVGMRDLIGQGLMSFPLRQVLIGAVVFGVLFPIFMRAGSAHLARTDPWMPLTMMGSMFLIVLWARPLIFWNERVSRIGSEIGMVIPRQRFLDAVQSLLARQFTLPAVLSGLALIGFILFRTGSVLAASVGVMMAFTVYIAAIWLVMLFITIGSSIPRFFVVFLCGYAIAGTVAGTFGLLVSKSTRPGSDGELWVVAPLAITVLLTATLRYFARRRVFNFEFGRMM